MDSKNPAYKLRQFEFPKKISDEDVENIKRMKLENQSIHDVRYWLIKKYWDNEAQKLSVSAQTIENWLKKYF